MGVLEVLVFRVRGAAEMAAWYSRVLGLQVQMSYKVMKRCENVDFFGNQP